MRLKVWSPAEVVLDEQVTKVKAEAENGWFCILPRHVGFVTSLVPGILSFETPGNPAEYLAVDYGILVKCGSEVAVSTRNAVRSADLTALTATVKERFRTLHEKERTARIFEAKLEADLVRQLMQFERYG